MGVILHSNALCSLPPTTPPLLPGMARKENFLVYIYFSSIISCCLLLSLPLLRLLSLIRRLIGPKENAYIKSSPRRKPEVRGLSASQPPPTFPRADSNRSLLTNPGIFFPFKKKRAFPRMAAPPPFTNERLSLTSRFPFSTTGSSVFFFWALLRVSPSLLPSSGISPPFKPGKRVFLFSSHLPRSPVAAADFFSPPRD